MAKIMPIEENGQQVGFFFDCPGCNGGHAVHVKPNKNPLTGASWDFNGNMEKPTFSPSIVTNHKFSPEANKPNLVCHIYVADGKIQFLPDCTHSLAGQTVDMPDLDF